MSKRVKSESIVEGSMVVVLGIIIVLTPIIGRIEHVGSKVDKMEKACLSKLDRVDERLGLLKDMFIYQYHG